MIATEIPRKLYSFHYTNMNEWRQDPLVGINVAAGIWPFARPFNCRFDASSSPTAVAGGKCIGYCVMLLNTQVGSARRRRATSIKAYLFSVLNLCVF